MIVGFLGLGQMGEPMTANLLRARSDLVVWNRSPAAARRLHTLGARVVATPALVLDTCDTVILMLANLDAINETLGRTAQAFTVPVQGRVLINMGTIAPVDSGQLNEALMAHGATYVEAPVSGSRVPAENGALVAMLAGPADVVEHVEALLTTMCRSVFRCGEVPLALTTKLAVNVFLINMKIAKLIADDYAPQATIRDVRYNSRLILDQAWRTRTSLPLLADCERLLGETEQLGHEDADMVAVLLALRESARQSQRSSEPGAG